MQPFPSGLASPFVIDVSASARVRDLLKLMDSSSEDASVCTLYVAMGENSLTAFARNADAIRSLMRLRMGETVAVLYPRSGLGGNARVHVLFQTVQQGSLEDASRPSSRAQQSWYSRFLASARLGFSFLRTYAASAMLHVQLLLEIARGLFVSHFAISLFAFMITASFAGVALALSSLFTSVQDTTGVDSSRLLSMIILRTSVDTIFSAFAFIQKRDIESTINLFYDIGIGYGLALALMA
ncbi:hypothetical protein Poli38472_010420 [Pythium oligandrum]|uniref:Uncharacterized protein n=1 Tax=Pythium oligandrum TaxID=41045 RepID=A0A8K1C378_PYTOL|nr:hypothetical protein Poli38472_010420 [Pythium oligandrum]|eukprot:TMW55538.1 hypothetical protein Poli38472_010420 [Pythium oligandrum]